MNLLAAWKKVLLFGLLGAVGCLAGWLVGEPYLYAALSAAESAGAGRAPSLISKPSAPTEPPPPSDDFKRRLDEAKAKTGDVQISLIWFDTNDLDLHCIDPAGFEIFYQTTNRRSPSGGELDVDRNASCKELTAEPVENIYWPKGKAPMGDYRVELHFFQQCPRGPARSDYKITVLQGGVREEFKGTISKEAPDGPRKIIHNFKLHPLVELYAPPALELPRAATLKVPIAIRREFFQGKVEVKAEQLPAGVAVEPVTLAPNQTEGELLLKTTDKAVPGQTRIKLVATSEGVKDHSADPQLTISAPRFSLWMVLAIGFWTALLAVGLCLALLAGQNRYLGRPLFAGGRVPLGLVIVGAVAAGFVSGSIGQSLFFALLAVGVAKLGLVLGWLLLGVLLGWGVSFFVPNLDAKKAALAGLLGGLLGGVVFWVASGAADWIGRFGGAALLGFCIGLMVAVVEVAFRRAWLEVRYGERETITVNLGDEPVAVGGDARACTVWARGAPEVALRYFVRDGQVHCEDVPAGQAAVVSDGDARAAGAVTVVVRTSGAPAQAQTVAPPAAPIPTPGVHPPGSPKAPAPPAVARPAPPKQPVTEVDDNMPMPMSPPAPGRPAAKSILDIDDARPATRPPAPAAKPAPPVSAKAPAPAKPPVPAAVKPPAPAAPAASGPKPGDADACPTCGRKSPGRPGARYCMVCDKTF
jgi:hypothetical protein